MIGIRFRSIRQKMFGMNVAALGMAGVVATASLLTVDLVQFRHDLARNLEAQARIIAENVTASLAFNDPKSASETLQAFKSTENIERAEIYAKDGSAFAGYRRSDLPVLANPADLAEPGAPQKDGARFENGHLTLYAPIRMDGERVGTIFLRSDLQAFSSVLRTKLLIGVLTALVASVLAFLLLSRLQESITGPIFELLGVMRRVSRENDLKGRATVRDHDELGLLAEGYNEMIERISQRESEVEYHRKNLEELVASRTAELGRALEAEKRFLASVSHEMRTPLNSIIGFTDLLVTTRLENEQRQFLKNVQTSSHHLLSLISDILDVSKIDAGQMELRDKTEFCIRELLTECVTIASSRLTEDVQSVLEVPEQARLVVGDDVRVKQIFINLLSNAFKFTREGTVRLTLVEREERADGRVALGVRVEDSGVGIDADKVPQLFSPFRQVHDGGFNGTGMGLFISRSLARLMGGDIAVESEKGKGSRFTVTLVLKAGRMTGAAAGEAAAAVLTPTKDPRRFASLRVLLVEDMEMNIAVAEQIFKKFFGFTPAVARNGLEAIERVRKETFDLVFMDIQMPKLDGIAATAEIRRLGIATPIVAMTANAFSGDIERAKAAGMDDYVTKPIKPDVIEKVLDAVTSPSGAPAHAGPAAA